MENSVDGYNSRMEDSEEENSVKWKTKNRSYLILAKERKEIEKKNEQSHRDLWTTKGITFLCY